MKNFVLSAHTIGAALLLAIATGAHAQTPAAQPRAASPARSSASILADGWAAVAAGRNPEAIRLANSLINDPWSSHEALTLRIAAELPSRGVAAALDAYDRWLTSAKTEDAFALRPIARAALSGYLKDPQPRIWVAAAAGLAEAGDEEGRQRLDAAAADAAAPVEVISALAELGNATALARLRDQVASGPGDKSTAIDAIRRSGSPQAADAIVPGLRDAAPTSKMAAAYALADLDATQAVPALREALKDPDPAVRGAVTLALARLGDESAGSLQEFAKSPASDIRLQVAKTEARRDPAGAWGGTAHALLQDPDAQIRMRAAELLLQYGRDEEAARGALDAVAADENPAVRLQVAQTLAEATKNVASGADLPTLRRLMRDRQPDIVISAAHAIVRMTGTRTRK